MKPIGPIELRSHNDMCTLLGIRHVLQTILVFLSLQVLTFRHRDSALGPRPSSTRTHKQLIAPTEYTEKATITHELRVRDSVLACVGR